MKNKIEVQIRQTNIKNLNDLTEDQKFEFQKAIEKEFKKHDKEIQTIIKNINNEK